MVKETVSAIDFIITPNGFILDFPDEQCDDTVQSQWRSRFENDRYTALYRLGFGERQEWFSPSGMFLYNISEAFIHALAQTPDIEQLREKAEIIPNTSDVQSPAANVPFISGAEYICAEWIALLWQKLAEVFRREISEFNGTTELYLTEKNQDLHVPGRIFFHLVENKEDKLPFAFMATYFTNADGNKSKHVPLKYALTEYKKDQKKLLELLSYLRKASDKSEFISGLIESGELFYPLKLTAEEAYTFLREIPLYEEAGILCRIPNWWKKRYDAMRVSASVGEKKPSYVGLDALISLQPQISVGGEKVTPDEIRELLRQSEGLAFLKGKWVEINHDKLRQILDTYNQIKKETSHGLTLFEAMRISLDSSKLSAASGDDSVQITNGEWLGGLLNSLRNPKKPDAVQFPGNFNAVLRPYQQTGVVWLEQLRIYGFGACLADDMGLGKTVEILAMLEKLRISSGGRNLLVVPASLLGNWQKEIGRFTPDMPFYIAHGNAADTGQLNDIFLTITTYGMIARNEIFQSIKWDYIILDEAQAIKNPSAKQTKTIKLLQGKYKIAMTGTPVENRFSDLWSLFDFINAGLLGSFTEFSKFTKGLSNSGNGYRRLREMISPFILRRLKTDKTIINDLPDKIEMKEYVSLSKHQIALYRSLVKELERSLNGSEGIQRKGMVLAALTKFKQICNHPDQYLGQSEYKEDLSGKFLHLRQICETIYEKRERVLVFTQYKEMTGPLAEFLSQIFYKKGLVLHGGTQVKKRAELVDKFNGEDYVPFMVLSLKAGGVGLNLTAANHVIHFDRWWNPAVENQATDRAFRIGQNKNVMVYKFICSGTVEEKIDRMIEDKIKLAGDLIGDGGETWITEMTNNQLMNLFRLE